MTSRYPHLLAPGTLGPLALRNRILMCPMGDTLGDPGGTVSERQRAYFEARARGGAALLLVGSVAVAYPAGCYDRRQLGIADDAFLPGLRDLTAAAHRHGALIAAQLVHDGMNALYDIAQGRPMLVPSEPPRYAPDRLSRMVTPDEVASMSAPLMVPGAAMEFRVADDADIAGVIEAFVDAAHRARDAGFDGVEIHAGHGYLIDAFLSPACNTRTDRWGGPVANRARLLCTVIERIRAREGAGFGVWCRMNAVEHFVDDGETLADAIGVARLAVAAGADALHVSAYASRSAGLGVTEAHTPHAPGALVANAAAVKAAVDVPVIAFGRLEPEAADAVLARGQADFIAMGRKLLADPDLPAKLAAGADDDIRPCIYQYRCIGNIFVGEPVACVVNAGTGHEDRGPVGPAADVRTVLVAGGGPAGLETARLLADAGHRVTLWEASDRLGGRLALAAATDDSLDRLLRWLLRQVDRRNVTVELGRRVAAPVVGFDTLVLASGAAWDAPAVPGGARVWALDDLRPWFDGGGGEPAERVAVLGGGKVGLSVAAFAARHGRRVTVVEPSGVFGTELGLPGRFRTVHDVQELGVELVGGTTVVRVTDDAVQLADGRTIAAGTVVSATAGVPPNAVDGAVVVGDAAGPRGIEGAMADADALARRLSA